MSHKGIDIYRTASIIGYSLLPIVGGCRSCCRRCLTLRRCFTAAAACSCGRHPLLRPPPAPAAAARSQSARHLTRAGSMPCARRAVQAWRPSRSQSSCEGLSARCACPPPCCGARRRRRCSLSPLWMPPIADGVQAPPSVPSRSHSCMVVPAWSPLAARTHPRTSAHIRAHPRSSALIRAHPRSSALSFRPDHGRFGRRLPSARQAACLPHRALLHMLRSHHRILSEVSTLWMCGQTAAIKELSSSTAHAHNSPGAHPHIPSEYPQCQIWFVQVNAEVRGPT